MKQQEVFNRVGGIIKELNDQFKYLQDDPSKINELELELFVANSHFLANHAEVLKKLYLQDNFAAPSITPTAVSPAATKEERYFEPFAHEPALEDRPVPHIDLSTETPEDDYSYIRESEPKLIRHELEIDDSGVDEEEAEKPVVNEPKPVAKAADKPIVIKPTSPIATPAEKPAPHIQKAAEAEEVLTINQRMSAQMGNHHETTLPAITDLKSAITLNDKLLFVKELFNGYSLAYSEAIDILNRFKSFEEAEKYLRANYATKNDWDIKPGTTEKFYTILRRRFS